MAALCNFRGDCPCIALLHLERDQNMDTGKLGEALKMASNHESVHGAFVDHNIERLIRISHIHDIHDIP